VRLVALAVVLVGAVGALAVLWWPSGPDSLERHVELSAQRLAERGTAGGGVDAAGLGQLLVTGEQLVPPQGVQLTGRVVPGGVQLTGEDTEGRQASRWVCAGEPPSVSHDPCS